MIPARDDEAGASRPPTRAARELASAAREALADTHAREARARRWIQLKRALCWLAIAGGAVACVVGLVDVFRERGGAPLAVGGFFVADVAGAILVAPVLMRAWRKYEKQRSIEKRFDDPLG
jgi:hypothetical protein